MENTVVTYGFSTTTTNNIFSSVSFQQQSTTSLSPSLTKTTTTKTTTTTTSLNQVLNDNNGGSDESSSVIVIISSSSTTTTKIETDWSMIESVNVQTLDGQTMKLGDVLTTKVSDDDGDRDDGNNDPIVVMSCLSHYGDYNAWELTQQYMLAIKEGRLSSNCHVVLVGIGSIDAAQTFANDIGLLGENPRITLVTDETGDVTEALDCYRGWLTVDKKHKEKYPYTDIPAGMKLLGMVLGLGSPGTIGNVLQGYTGDITQNYGPFGRRWVVNALTQGSEKGRFPKVDLDLDLEEENESLKPFELATLRLQTGLHIVAKWRKLGPKDGDLFTRMGGTFVFH